MSENLDSPSPNVNDLTELPTQEGQSAPAGRIVAGRYDVLSILGRGGMGKVWHAFDLKLRVDVALKALLVDVKANPASVEALRREVRTAREVMSPNVCRIFDLVVEEESELISMEYIDGITLLKMLVEKGPLDLREARDIAAQFLAGLEAIHRAGLVHRDLKPENLMITRTGRVVVMDFGIAKQATQIGGTISGTIPYMSPEQLAGEKVDARSDLFSAGVVLAEMIHPEGVLSQKTREGIWNMVRKDPMQLPDGPWKAVIARAVAPNPADRFQSAAALSRALEQVTQRIDTMEERKPYPGLASFSASDAEYFFGRELEAEMLIRKLQQLHFTALIGPSGAGKTSMLRAGLIPALPAAWSHLLCYPGDAPLLNLAQGLAPQLSGDAEAFAKMVRFEEPDVALSILRRWRQKYSEAVLIVDRFEELYTLNNSSIQSRFAQLLGRAVLEADVRVLLVMRDDFLMFCHQQPALTPIFSELSGLSPLGGAALRQALVQPALKCGYRFEDETLVDEILADVEKERGALPLMAFAAARLWEKRDRQSGVLTRQAYREIGGVAGALAQHAEATMEKIGTERQPIVREIFRNLITAQNTRAARDTEELLTVFPERNVADEVLRTLIDARLLTSFEAPQTDGTKPKSRVEIIHESLLSNWPRLIRWQTQDADSAQIRDQLRQAAQLWEQRNRSEDLLWTGTAFLEFQAWRTRYSGGLTATEEAFAKAMQARATRRRNRRRMAVAAIIVILLSVVAVISIFWRDAVLQAKRAEAGKLLALGRGELEVDPNRALAYALAATEMADTSDGRLFALKALWTGPISSVKEMEIRPLSYANFNPDGSKLVIGGSGGVQILAGDGSTPQVLSNYFSKSGASTWPEFSEDGEYVLWRSTEDLRVVHVWSMSQKKIVRKLPFEGFTSLKARGKKVFLITDATGQLETKGWGMTRVRVWKFDSGEPKVIGDWDREGISFWDIDPGGKFLAYGKGSDVFVRSLENLKSSEKLIGKHASDITSVAYHPDGKQIASGDSAGEIHFWPVVADSKEGARVFKEKEAVQGLVIDRSGSLLAIQVGLRSLRLRDLSAPDEADSILLFRGGLDNVNHLTFHPTQPLLVVVARERLLFYRLDNKFPYIFRSDGPVGSPGSLDTGFTPDGRYVVTCFGAASPVQLWSVPDQEVPSRRDFLKIASINCRTAIDPLGRYILTTIPNPFLISLQDGTAQPLPDHLGGSKNRIAFSMDGKYAAAGAAFGPRENLGIEIWDLEKKSVRLLQQSKGTPFYSLKFSADGNIFAGDMLGNLWQWDPARNTGTVVVKRAGIVLDIDTSPDGRYVIAAVALAKQIGELERATSELILYDRIERKSRNITTHGNRVSSVAFHPDGKTLVTGDLDGIMRVEPIVGEEAPHVMMGSETAVFDVAVHPSGNWIVSSERGRPLVRLWRMPQGKPFHSLPHDEFLKRLRALTNVRVVEDKSASTGYRIDYSPFPGWKAVMSEE